MTRDRESGCMAAPQVGFRPLETGFLHLLFYCGILETSCQLAFLLPASQQPICCTAGGAFCCTDTFPWWEAREPRSISWRAGWMEEMCRPFRAAAGMVQPTGTHTLESMPVQPPSLSVSTHGRLCVHVCVHIITGLGLAAYQRPERMAHQGRRTLCGV